MQDCVSVHRRINWNSISFFCGVCTCTCTCKPVQSGRGSFGFIWRPRGGEEKAEGGGRRGEGGLREFREKDEESRCHLDAAALLESFRLRSFPETREKG
jgi:hypothetical protein